MAAAKRKTLMEYSPAFARNIPPRRLRRQACPCAAQKRSDLQDFGDCIQSSQIGPHLVQPLRARPMATTLKISTNRLNMTHTYSPQIYHKASSQAFSSRAKRVSIFR